MTRLATTAAYGSTIFVASFLALREAELAGTRMLPDVGSLNTGRVTKRPKSGENIGRRVRLIVWT